MKFYYSLLVIFFMNRTLDAQMKSIGQIIQFDPKLEQILSKDSKIEVIAEGFVWSEGPVWVKDDDFLLFSDVPANTIYRWKETEGLREFLKPSGYTGVLPYSDEPGSNGLIINQKGELVACEHGDRRISAMPFSKGGKRTIADNYQSKRFNSPNDIVQKSNGDYYFTDPPYGLPNKENDLTRETPIFGVYRVHEGKVSLLIDSMTRPNGLAFSPDEKTLYVAQSDPERAYLMAFQVLTDGSVGEGQIFYDMTPMVKQGLQGLPDGLKVDRNGNIFTTGPGGVLILSPDAKLLGRIETGQATANCAFGNDGSVLYITADAYVLRVRTKTKGVGF